MCVKLKHNNGICICFFLLNFSTAIATADGSATQGTDYTMKSESITVAAYDTATFSVDITDDDDAEMDETFTVTITGDVGTTTSTTVTIGDNDGK